MTRKYWGLILGFIIMVAILPDTAKAQNQTAVQNKQIIFIENDFNEALKQAAAQNKYLFVDAYASWCGPCKMLKSTTFKNKKAAEFYNANFINVAIDMEKGQGPELAAQWGMQAYPTLIIFNPKGKPVLGSVGYIKADDLIKFGEAGLKK
ncbi:thioredoxin family protein [Mucilaginibacter sp. McL0603]|uniref:thioredoxin family protein n=1 Tax=Mucilaginibacter sp. McL0603 TaxID=3415670 RepID=UPI003CF4F44A